MAKTPARKPPSRGRAGKTNASAGGAPRLDADAWVRAGLRALVDGGIGAVSVEQLAAKLGVTKGSFYWHLADRPALLQAMVVSWEQGSTFAVIDQVKASAQTPVQRLERLLAITTRGGADRLEAAMRGWGSVDAEVGAAVARVDREREEFVCDLLEAAGFARNDALVRTRVVYLALVGEFSRTSHGAPRSPKETWVALLGLLLSGAGGAGDRQGQAGRALHAALETKSRRGWSTAL